MDSKSNELNAQSDSNSGTGLAAAAPEVPMQPNLLFLIGPQKIEQISGATFAQIQANLQQLRSGCRREAHRPPDVGESGQATDRNSTESFLWLDLDGPIGHPPELWKLFDLHSLVIEDIENINHRPKVDIYEKYIYIVLKMIQYQSNVVETEQLNIVVGDHFVLTIQGDRAGDCLGDLRQKMQQKEMVLPGPDFLAYRLIDAVIDSYFPVLESIGEDLEELEDDILLNPSPILVSNVHDIKRSLLVIRRALWPARDLLNSLLRENPPFISAQSHVFLRDCYDHTVQLVDLVENFRDLGSGLMDVYLSSVSNKMNDIMRVLTVITTIFVPLTFLAGVYGMNFNPDKSPYNMPELNSRYGYPITLLFMLAIALAELAYFYRQGWIFTGRSAAQRPDMSGS